MIGNIRSFIDGVGLDEGSEEDGGGVRWVKRSVRMSEKE